MKRSRYYKYKFNGMEWQDEMNLNYYDFGARNYDATLGRWMNVDLPTLWSYSIYSDKNFKTV